MTLRSMSRKTRWYLVVFAVALTPMTTRGEPLSGGSGVTTIAGAATAPHPAFVFEEAGSDDSHASMTPGNNLRHVIVDDAMAMAKMAKRIEPTEDFDAYVEKESRGSIAVESHTVTTEDGFILTLKRMYATGNHTESILKRPVLYMQHGLLASSWSWLINGLHGGPAFVFAQAGYDVWLGNNRGNVFSRKHRTISEDSEEFWQFTYEEMANYDLVASIQYVIEHTDVSTLTYMGWSQGTTQMFVAGLPEFHGAYLKSKINLFVALSPVTYLGHCNSNLLYVMTNMHLAAAVSRLFDKGFMLGPEWEHTVEQTMCRLTFGLVCKLSVSTICGYSDLDDAAAIADMTAHFPAGTSVKDMVHWEQGVASGKFARYDYGKEGNKEHYQKNDPPSYDLSKHAIPIALLSGTNDDLVAIEDLKMLKAALPTDTIVFEKSYRKFSHMTWVVGKRETWGWIEDVKELLQHYNPI